MYSGIKPPIVSSNWPICKSCNLHLPMTPEWTCKCNENKIRKESAQYAHWVVGQFLEKGNRQLLMQLPGNIERGIKAP